MEITGLGYIGITARDPLDWRPFAEDLLGLMPASGVPGSDSTGSLYYRLDDRRWRVAIHPDDQPGLAYMGWELPDRDAFARAVHHLEKEGVTRTDAASPADRGVSDLFGFVDTYGYVHEIYYGAPTNLDVPFHSPVGTSGFVTWNGIGHVLFVVPDAASAERYYGRLLGLKSTDRMDMGAGKRTIFMRWGTRHHSFAVTDVLPEPGFNHLMLETLDIEDVGRAWDRVGVSDTPVVMTLGQHANDPAISFYVESPSGFAVELGCKGMLIDDATWTVREVGPEELWGHRGPTMDAIEEGGGRA